MKNKDIVISMRCDRRDIEKLKEISREESYRQKKDIYYTDIIRNIIKHEILVYSGKKP